MRKAIASVILAGMVLIPASEASACVRKKVRKPRPAPVRIYEDDPRWNCRTMGNRICGPNR